MALRKYIALFSFSFFFTSIPVFAQTYDALAEDLERILSTSSLSVDKIIFEWSESHSNQVKFSCSASHQIKMEIQSSPDEQVSTFYYGLHKLGFLFPHPRRQISPSADELLNHCGEVVEWHPSIHSRGFHLHTQHPGEWMTGFYEGNEKIARETILWMARNFQNRIQIEYIRADQKKLGHYLRPLYALMKDLQIEFGISVGLSSTQQHAFALIPLFSAITGINDKYFLKDSIQSIANEVPFDYVSLEFGTTEFTSTSFPRTLKWLNLACHTLQSLGKKTYAISHVSTGQSDPKYGNFNFLTQFTDSCLGAYVHTVMDYGLDDKYTPVYGRTNFDDMKDFALSQNGKRETIYYPETSYFVGMDIDVPIFLTDYLVARAQDYQWASQNGLTGHINFSTGQELGYWLFDWNLALNANQEYLGDALAGLRLLGEDTQSWREILDFQTQYLKNEQGIQYISTSNLLDEVYSKFMIHKRTLLRDLGSRPDELKRELKTLESAIAHEPSLEKVRDPELHAMLEVTWRRIEHAYDLRKAIEQVSEKNIWLKRAEAAHADAALWIEQALALQRYNDSIVFEKRDNPTSYGYGYGWVATQLYFWTREEEIVRKNETSPFFMNIYNPLKLLF